MLHIVGSKALGGAERFYLALVQALHERGQPITAVLRKHSQVVAALPAVVPRIEVAMRTVWDPFARWSISRMTAQMKPEIVQTYMGRATRLTHIPKGKGTVHVARLGGYYGLKGYRHAHAWIGNTRGVCDYMIAGGLPAGRVFHISNFIDTPSPLPAREVKALRSSWRIPEDALVVMTAGRFVEVKGHTHLLAAFARLPARLRGHELWLLMVGDGVLFSRLQRQATRLGIESRICWTGWQTDPAPFYHLADVIAFPSLERETLGNVILEAWVFRKPLVTSSFRGALEITHHGDDCWRVPCADPGELASGLATVLADEALAERLASAGLERVQREFSRARVVDQYLALYEKLLREG